MQGLISFSLPSAAFKGHSGSAKSCLPKATKSTFPSSIRVSAKSGFLMTLQAIYWNRNNIFYCLCQMSFPTLRIRYRLHYGIHRFISASTYIYSISNSYTFKMLCSLNSLFKIEPSRNKLSCHLFLHKLGKFVPH